MFAKKFLSIVGLLFLGSGITSVSATGIEGCDNAGVTINDCTAQTADEPTGVCISGNKIYTYAESSKETCYVGVGESLDAGVHVLFVSGTSVTDEILSSIEAGDNTNYLLYVCDDSKCNLTNGFVKGKDDAYIKIISGEAESVDVSSNLAVSEEANCTPGSIFKDEDSTIKFCIAAGHGEALVANPGDTTNYIVTKDAKLTGVTDTTDMVIQVSDEAFVLNTVYTDDEYCVYGTSKIQNRISNFCSGTILDNMYSCTKGLCSKKDSPIVAGSYIVKSGSNYNLYKCEEDSGSSTVSCNVDKEDESNGILLVKEEINEKEYTFQKVHLTSELNSANLSTESLFIYDCVAGACKPAEALIRAGTIPATAYCDGTNKCALGTETITLDGNIGTISYSESKFIITPSNRTPVEIENGKSYAFAGKDNAFVVIKNVGNAIVAEAQILDSTVYVNESNEIVSDNEFEACVESTKKYTVNTTAGTATAENCTPPEIECQLDTSTPENNANCAEGYYLKSTLEGNNKGKLVKVDMEPGTLYHCNGVKQACTVVSSKFKPGFYMNVDAISKEVVQYLKCPTVDSCKAVAVTNTACSDAKVGGLILDDTDPANVKYSICIDDNTNAVELSDANATAGVKVFISIDTTDDEGADAFGDKVANSFVLLDVGVNCLKNESDQLNYRYTGVDQKLVRRTDVSAKGEICSEQQNMKEFKKGNNSIYTKT